MRSVGITCDTIRLHRYLVTALLRFSGQTLVNDRLPECLVTTGYATAGVPFISAHLSSTDSLSAFTKSGY